MSVNLHEESISNVDQTKKREPAENVEEWIKKNGYDVWPEPSDVRYMLPEKEKQMLGSKEEIIGELRKHAPFPMYMLERLDCKADELQRNLNVYASRIVAEDSTSKRHKDNLFHSPNNIMKKAAESDAVKAHRGKLRDKNSELRTLILGSKARSVEATRFPGFNAHELTELPHGLEAPQILDRITKAQSFNTGFEKFWKKLFLSEASVAVMLDTFWWFFIDKYESKKKKHDHDKKKLFNRIADSFVALFISVNPEIKDKFFAVYSDCLAQVLFAAYLDAFTDSHKIFDDNFKQDIASCVSDWIAGVKAPPFAWKHWDIKKLRPKGLNSEKEEDKKKVVLIKDGKINHEADFSIEVIPEDTSDFDLGLSREPTMMTTRSRIPPIGAATAPSTRLTTAMPLRESHETGPGPGFERVLFNIGGRSPLVAHYLYVKGLSTNENHGRQVRRTEISKIQPPAPTYREVIRNSRKMKKALNAEYQRISDSANKDIAQIERHQAEQVREIEGLKQQIIHHNIDMKILSERILDLRERQITSTVKKTKSNRVCDFNSDDSFDEDW